MKRQIIGSLLIVTLLFGCGGGSGDQSNNNGNPTQQTTVKEKQDGDQNNIFEYPDYFKDFSTFEGMSKLNNAISLPYVANDGFKLFYIRVMSRKIGTEFGFMLKSVETEEKLSRASCEKGALIVNYYTYDIYKNKDIYGSFDTSNFSGPMTQLEGVEPVKCPYLYYDGSIVYNFKGDSLVATFGKSEKPFFYNGSGGAFDGANAYLGTLRSTNAFTFTIDDSFEFFTVQTNDTVEDYHKTSYIKDDLLIYKNLTYSNVTSDNKTIINADYKRQWQEFGETFNLHTIVSNIVIGADDSIASGSATYNLSVVGKSEKYINVDVEYGADVKVKYNKEGVINKNY